VRSKDEDDDIYLPHTKMDRKVVCRTRGSGEGPSLLAGARVVERLRLWALGKCLYSNMITHRPFAFSRDAHCNATCTYNREERPADKFTRSPYHQLGL
jgi:hypothetical protein